MSMVAKQTAHAEYANRPADERYESLPALINAAQQDRNYSREKIYTIGDVRVVAGSPSVYAGGQRHPGTVQSVMLESARGIASLTHWSFSQLARIVGAPAGYLRTLTPSIAATALEYGRSQLSADTETRLLIRGNAYETTPVVRSLTSDSYGRLWDADLYKAVNDTIVEPSNGVWAAPPTWGGEPAGYNRGDRDSFVFLVNGGSIVTDPSGNRNATGASGQHGDQLFRGIMIRNSEVGAAFVDLESFYFRAVCGNHLLWGAITDSNFRRRHVGTNVLSDTLRAINELAIKWGNASASRDEAIVRGLINHEIAKTKEDVIKELRFLGCTLEQATAAYNRCELTETVSPRSYWGIAQGITRISQDESHNDSRLLLDKIAAMALAKGSRLVAA